MNNATIVNMDDYPATAKTYWWVITALGMIAIAACLFAVTRIEPRNWMMIAAGAAAAAVAGLFPVRIPGAKTSVSAAEVFTFLLLLSFGPAAAVLAAAIEAACISLRTSKRWTSRLGSPAMAAIAMYASGSLYTWGATLLTADSGDIVAKLLLLIVAAVVYFAIGTVLISTLIKLKRKEPIRPLAILRDHRYLGLGYAASAAIAGWLHLSFGRFETPAMLAAALMSIALLVALHFYYRRAAA